LESSNYGDPKDKEYKPSRPNKAVPLSKEIGSSFEEGFFFGYKAQEFSVKIWPQ